ncbi:GNAT family N-acetyltransferase [Maricaulis salignorans]|uniref:Acetyltransferase, GNAT family n=1 Tax=Maricaulis salignorans TaxID=144026 RepID=A0A1G9PZT7_9PROT|nr:GNAT family N-acetyltransferase [Maricaulis salignorans]SDM03747.1 Acetyltransferase, GNAT family [Maricaulis salignorans]
MQTTSNHPAGIVLRRGERSDIAALTRVFYRAVREGAGPEYSTEQRAAWAPAPPEVEAWDKRLTPQAVFVAELDGAVIGFMSVKSDGYIDLAFVDPEHIGHGVAQLLYDRLEAHARETGMERLYSDASARARILFERQGWTVEAAQKPMIRGVELHNYRMSKALADED